MECLFYQRNVNQINGSLKEFIRWICIKKLYLEIQSIYIKLYFRKKWKAAQINLNL
jgi:hypothetical protein